MRHQLPNIRPTLSDVHHQPRQLLGGHNTLVPDITTNPSNNLLLAAFHSNLSLCLFTLTQSSKTPSTALVSSKPTPCQRISSIPHKMPSTGAILITVVGITTSIGAYIADWNETHIYNPRWPPHAKFHNGQTMSMGLVLGLTTLYYLYRGASTPELKSHFVHTAAWAGSIYWVTQLSAFLYPGSLAVDPEFGTFAPQVYIAGSMLVFAFVGLLLERSRLAPLLAARKNRSKSS
jgi:hypothetical protein